MVVMGTRWAALLLTGALLVGCSGDPSEGSRAEADAPVDNSTLSAAELEKATMEAFLGADTFRASVDLRTAGSPVDLDVEVADLVRFRGRFGDMVVSDGLLTHGSMYLRPQFDSLAEEDRERWRLFLGDRWLVTRVSYEAAVPLDNLMRDVRYAFPRGGAGGGAPRSGKKKQLRDLATVSYRYSNGITVRVPRFGPPLPVVVETPGGSVRYSDYGADVEIEIPPVGETVPVSDLLAAFD